MIPSGPAAPPPSDAAGAPEPQPQPAAGARRLPRAAVVSLATLGLLAVTAASAAVTVAVGRPDARRSTAHARPVVSAAPSASGTPVPESAAPSASPTPSPTPHSTVRGHVSDGVHSGDLRYFLLPLPQDAEAYGDEDGTALSLEGVAKSFRDAAQTKQILRDYGFRAAAYRTYRTADGSAEVTTRLIRFSSASRAETFAEGMTMHGTPFQVDGVSGAKAFRFKPAQEGGTGTVIGLFAQGDVEAEVTVEVKGTPSASLLGGLLKRQQTRLSTGR